MYIKAVIKLVNHAHRYQYYSDTFRRDKLLCNYYLLNRRWSETARSLSSAMVERDRRDVAQRKKKRYNNKFITVGQSDVKL